MAITGSVFSLKDVANVFDEDQRPSSLLQARNSLLNPTTNSSLSLFQGSNSPEVVDVFFTSNTFGSIELKANIRSIDNGKACIQYRSLYETSSLFTSSLVDFTPSSSFLQFIIPDIKNSIYDYEYTLASYNGFNDTKDFSIWEGEENKLIVPFILTSSLDLQSVLNPVSADGDFYYSKPIPTSAADLSELEVDIYPFMVQACTNFTNYNTSNSTPPYLTIFDSSVPYFRPIRTKVYIEKNKSIENTSYFILKSLFDKVGISSDESQLLNQGYGYFLKLNSSSTLYRYCKYKASVQDKSFPNFVFDPVHSSTCNCTTDISEVILFNKPSWSNHDINAAHTPLGEKYKVPTSSNLTVFGLYDSKNKRLDPIGYKNADKGLSRDLTSIHNTLLGVPISNNNSKRKLVFAPKNIKFKNRTKTVTIPSDSKYRYYITGSTAAIATGSLISDGNISDLCSRESIISDRFNSVRYFSINSNEFVTDRIQNLDFNTTFNDKVYIFSSLEEIQVDINSPEYTIADCNIRPIYKTVTVGNNSVPASYYYFDNIEISSDKLFNFQTVTFSTGSFPNSDGVYSSQIEQFKTVSRKELCDISLINGNYTGTSIFRSISPSNRAYGSFSDCKVCSANTIRPPSETGPNPNKKTVLLGMYHYTDKDRKVGVQVDGKYIEVSKFGFTGSIPSYSSSFKDRPNFLSEIEQFKSRVTLYYEYDTTFENSKEYYYKTSIGGNDDYTVLPLSSSIPGNYIHVIQTLDTGDEKISYVQSLGDNRTLQRITDVRNALTPPEHPYPASKFDPPSSGPGFILPFSNNVQLFHSGSDCCLTLVESPKYFDED